MTSRAGCPALGLWRDGLPPQLAHLGVLPAQQSAGALHDGGLGARAGKELAQLDALSVSAALATGGLARGMRRLLPDVVRLGGVVLIASGLHPLFHWLPVLPGLPNERLAHRRETPSNRLRAFLEANAGLFAGLFALLAAGLAEIDGTPSSSSSRQTSQSRRAARSPSRSSAPRRTQSGRVPRHQTTTASSTPRATRSTS